jgi:ribosomal protein S18 acetylase RimI-like enzyme
VFDVRPMDSRTFLRLADELAGIYAAAMRRPPEVVAQRRSIMSRHRGYAGFRAFGGWAGPRLVGFAYGYTGAPGQWWHDCVAAALGPARSADWLADAFEVAELHVAPDSQGQGLGRRLLRALLAGLPHRTTLLSTPDTDSPARRLYRSDGFVDLVGGFRFPGGVEPFCLMGRRLVASTAEPGTAAGQ